MQLKCIKLSQHAIVNNQYAVDMQKTVHKYTLKSIKNSQCTVIRKKKSVST